jgi:tripartite-type tricarboxylate transporter receptor subunit TctC
LAFDGLVGLFGPPGMPVEFRERIAADVRAVAVDPIIIDRLTVTGQLLNIGGATAFADDIEAQRAKLATTAKGLDIKEAR